MIIAGKEYSSIAISGKDNEVLAVVSDTEIIEKDGVHVSFLQENDEVFYGEVVPRISLDVPSTSKTHIDGNDVVFSGTVNINDIDLEHATYI